LITREEVGRGACRAEALAKDGPAKPRPVCGSPGGFAPPKTPRIDEVAALALKRHRLTRDSLAARLPRLALEGNRPYLKSKSFRDVGVLRGPILREKTQVQT